MAKTKFEFVDAIALDYSFVDIYLAGAPNCFSIMCSAETCYYFWTPATGCCWLKALAVSGATCYWPLDQQLFWFVLVC